MRLNPSCGDPVEYNIVHVLRPNIKNDNYRFSMI